MKEDNSKGYKKKLTTIICFGHFAFGVGLTILGQTLPDIKRLLNVDNSEIAYAFVIRSAFYCIGAVICGCLYNRYNRQLLYSLFLCIFGCSVLLEAHITSLVYFLINEAIIGFCSGAVDTASSVVVLEMWEKDSNPYLQAIHMFFAIGTAIGPLVSAPFLSKGVEYPNLVAVPFSVAGLILITSSVVVFYFESFFPYKTPHRSMERKNEIPVIIATSEHGADLKITKIRKQLRAYNLTCVLLGSLILCFYTGTEVNIFNYWTTFVYEMKLGITKQTASIMSATFGAMFAVFRAVSIFAATRLSTSTMIYISFADLFVAYLILLAFGSKSVAVIWVAAVFIGAGCSSVYGSVYAFIEQRIDITNRIGSIFMFSCSFISIVWPFILGNSIESNAMVFVYVNAGCIAFVILAFVTLHSTNLWKKSILDQK